MSTEQSDSRFSAEISGRRGFMKRSVIMAVAAAQPALLCGLLRASGSGSGTGTTGGTTVPKTETTDPFTTPEDTTDGSGFDTTLPHTTIPESTSIPEETSTVPEEENTTILV